MGDEDDRAAVRAAAEAAESLIFSRFSPSEVRDYDVTVRFEAGVLEVDVVLEVSNATEAEQQRAADDAALAAREAADRIIDSADG